MPKKKRNRAVPRGLVILALILVATNVATVYYFTVMNPSIPLEDVPLYIKDITGDNAESYIGRTVTLSAYLIIAGGYTLLVSNPLLYLQNSYDPSNCVFVTYSPTEDFQDLNGHQVNVKGVVKWEGPQLDYLGLDYLGHEDLHIQAFQGLIEELNTPPALVNFTPVIDTNPTKYAVLYSGGYDVGSAYYRYWNDIAYTYLLLLLSGYSSNNIYVIYKDGVGGSDPVPVDYPATHDSMETVFGILSGEMGTADTLFFYTTNHGQPEGICTWIPLDPDPLNHTEVQGWFDSITCEYMIVVMNQCFSGAFIPFLSATNRIIMTACEADAVSYVCDHNMGWDEFTFHFLSALYGFWIDLDTTPVWADLNDNGVSMGEAFGYACYMDSQNEIPLYDDNGDGIPSTVGNIVGTDTDFGNHIYF